MVHVNLMPNILSGVSSRTAFIFSFADHVPTNTDNNTCPMINDGYHGRDIHYTMDTITISVL